MLARGGAPGELFNSPKICDALAASKAYRIVAVGHSEHVPEVYKYADYKVNHPANAGRILRELIKTKLMRRLFLNLDPDKISRDSFRGDVSDPVSAIHGLLRGQ